jgi:peptidoglycan hydrolase-like protein with peptidoglycan-binding domain
MFLLRKDSKLKGHVRYIEDVRAWQTFLKSHGHHLKVDGDYGDDTEKATRAFQQAHGLEVDGRAGEETFKAARPLGFQSGLDAPLPEAVAEGQLAAVKGSERVSDTFKSKVVEIARRLKTNPNFLMAVMSFETGHTFSPSVKSRSGSGATGLIQFMPSTAKGLGTTIATLERMSAEEQLDYVEAHFKPFTGKLTNVEDCYMAVLWPRAVGKPNHYVLFWKGTKSYTQNAGLDRDGDGKVTKTEAASKVVEILRGAGELSRDLGLTNEVVLGRGDQGAEVDEVQKILVRLGFLHERQYRTKPGLFGPRTEDAIREFQHEHDLDSNGRVTMATRNALREALLKAPPDVQVEPSAIETVLPAQGPGFKTYNREPGGRDQYGRKEVIDALLLLGRRWDDLHPECPIQFGDISRKGGGPFPPHQSHRSGNDVDARPFRKDLLMLPEDCRKPTYSRPLTKELIDLVRKEFPRTIILFNDERLIKAGLTRFAAGHFNHLHIRFL